MMSMSVSTARSELHKLLDAVERGEEVTLTRHGSAVAVVVRPDLLRARRADAVFATAAHVAELVAAGRNRPLSDDRGISADRAEELVAEVRVGRSGR